MPKKLTEKERKEMLKRRYGDIEEKPISRKKTEEELIKDDKIWEGK